MKTHRISQILCKRPDALLVPDLLLSAKIDTMPEKGKGIGVVDSSARDKSLALMRFAAAQSLPMFAMERRLVNKPLLIRNTGLNPGDVQTPAIQDIHNHRAWVVGRFHFAMALLVHGIPFAAQPTGVPKMQAMLNDAGLAGCVLPDNWGDLTPDAMQAAVQVALDSWDSNAMKRAEDYVEAARIKSDDMFARISALVSG